jgi:hypothetical protein
MKKITKSIKKWWRDFRDVTPPEWKRLMTTSASLAAALTAGWLVVPSLNVTLPEEWGKYVAIAVAVLTAVSVYAKSHTVNKPTDEEDE